MHIKWQQPYRTKLKRSNQMKEDKIIIIEVHYVGCGAVTYRGCIAMIRKISARCSATKGTHCFCRSRIRYAQYTKAKRQRAGPICRSDGKTIQVCVDNMQSAVLLSMHWQILFITTFYIFFPFVRGGPFAALFSFHLPIFMCYQC